MAQKQIMDTETSAHGKSGSEPSWLTGISSNAALAGTVQNPRHQLVHRKAANKGTENLTPDTHIHIVSKPWSSKNEKQHAVGCEHIQIEINSRELTL